MNRTYIGGLVPPYTIGEFQAEVAKLAIRMGGPIEVEVTGTAAKFTLICPRKLLSLVREMKEIKWLRTVKVKK